jgi:hypothetical protein
MRIHAYVCGGGAGRTATLRRPDPAVRHASTLRHSGRRTPCGLSGSYRLQRGHQDHRYVNHPRRRELECDDRVLSDERGRVQSGW